jgi:hypothetical protein
MYSREKGIIIYHFLTFLSFKICDVKVKCQKNKNKKVFKKFILGDGPLMMILGKKKIQFFTTHRLCVSFLFQHLYTVAKNRLGS